MCYKICIIMIIYNKSIKEFKKDVFDGILIKEIESQFKAKNIGIRESEKRAWENSFMHVNNVLVNSEVSNETYISIEFIIPLNNYKNRVDLIFIGGEENKNLLVVELKQWSTVLESNVVNKIKTYMAGNIVESLHPSLQASSYKYSFIDFNEQVRNFNVNVESIAYLHNYESQLHDYLLSEKFQDAISDSNIYLKHDNSKFSKLLNTLFSKGSGKEISNLVLNSRYSPSKSVIKLYSEILQGNSKLKLTVDQMELISTLISRQKNGTIHFVNAMPGTGKTVIAAHLLRLYLEKGLKVAIATPNSQLRNTLVNSITNEVPEFKKSLKNLVLGTGSFSTKKDEKYDVLIIDEAQSIKGLALQGITEKTIYVNILNSTKMLILLFDDKQKFHHKTIGGENYLKKIALENNWKKDLFFDDYKLTTQIRSSGQNNFIQTIEYLFHQVNTTPYKINNFDFRIFNDVSEMRDTIFSLNKNNNARMLATYSYKWISKDDVFGKLANDIVINEFKMPWNFAGHESWTLTDKSINEVGSLHVVMGQEFDHIGVIIGKHLTYKNGKLIVNWKNWYGTAKNGTKNNPDEQLKLVYNEIYTLLTRAKKSCFLYIEDEELRKEINRRFEKIK